MTIQSVDVSSMDPPLPDYFVLTKSSNQKRVPIGAIQPQHVNRGFGLGRINQLTNPQQGKSLGNIEKLCCGWVCGRAIDFFIGVGELDTIVVLQDRKKRSPFHRGSSQPAKINSR